MEQPAIEEKREKQIVNVMISHLLKEEASFLHALCGLQGALPCTGNAGKGPESDAVLWTMDAAVPSSHDTPSWLESTLRQSEEKDRSSVNSEPRSSLFPLQGKITCCLLRLCLQLYGRK